MSYELKHFKLVDGKPVECDLFEYAELFTDIGRRRVHQTQIGWVGVSTVLMGFVYCCDGVPVDGSFMFESMIFGGKLDETQVRCMTLGEAKQNHAELVDQVKAIEVISDEIRGVG